MPPGPKSKRRPKSEPPIKVYVPNPEDRQDLLAAAKRIGLSPSRYLLAAGLEKARGGSGP